MQLDNVLAGVEMLAVAGSLKAEVTGVAYDSREVRPGSLFVAIRGEKLDGDNFVPQALGAGAAAILSERPPRPEPRAAWVQVRSARQALAQAAANYYGHPARSVKLIGVTGTNGKTTTTYLLESILRAAGHGVGLFGTVEYHTADLVIPAAQTTPESADLQRFLAGLREAGAGWAVLEVSSHGLALDRVYACPFAAAVFTNLSRDHLDFHQTMDNYFEAKKKLFLGCGTEPPPLCVLNADEPRTRELEPLCHGQVVVYGLKANGPGVTARRPQLTFSGTEFTLQTPAGTAPVRSALVGRSNLSNLLAAAATAFGLGLPLETIARGLGALERVPGRFERVDAGQPFAVVVDFAHTDLAFSSLLETARELARQGGQAGGGRILIVFGSGGDRDRTKRPLMGEIAGRLADHVILTTDNPRSEDPVRIINDILVGVQKAGGSHTVEVDRERAFEKAFEMAREGDIVLLAGKGHQATQVYRDHTEPWSDAEVARRLLERRGFARAPNGRAEAAKSNAR